MRVVIGWDVGGAHVKAARAEAGRIAATLQAPCPLWLGPDRLDAALADMSARLGPAALHAATMTGELADCYADRAEGVAAITAALARMAGPVPLRLYTVGAGFVPPGEAVRRVRGIASANWHATATLAAREAPDALLVDIGSTTTDLVPIRGGRPVPAGHTDAERLACGELAYTGLVRTPLMALARRAPFAGAWTALAAERFATTADVYRLLGELDEEADQMPTADGRAKTQAASAARLARMVGHDAADAEPAAWRDLAAWLAEAQLRQIADAAALVLSRARLPDGAPLLATAPTPPLAARLAARLGRPLRSLRLSPAIAVALLAAEAG